MTAVEKLETDTATLNQTLDKFVAEAESLSDQLTYVSNNLGYPAKIESDLKKLENDLGIMRTVLQAVKVFPEVAEEAQVMIEAIDAIIPPIKEAESYLDAFAKKIEPTKKLIDDFNAELQAFIEKVKLFQAELVKSTATLDNAQACIDSLPDGDAKSQLNQDLQTAAQAADVPVAAFNQALVTALATIDQAEQVIEQQIEPIFNELTAIEKSITDLYDEVEKAIPGLQDLANYLNQEFCFKFPYPCPKWDNPFKTCDYKVCVSAAIIAQGADAVEKYIKDLLSSTMWDILKGLGVNKYINDLINDMEKGLDALLKELHLDFTIAIPGLDEIEGLLDKLTASLGDLGGDLDLDFDGMTALMNSITQAYAEINKIYEACKDLGGCEST